MSPFLIAPLLVVGTVLVHAVVYRIFMTRLEKEHDEQLQTQPTR